MSEFLLTATERPMRLVNRVPQLESIKRAIYQPEHSLEIILLSGPGGLGKSRLVEWAMACAGNSLLRKELEAISPEFAAQTSWGRSDELLVGDPIDMADTRLGTRPQFMHAIRDALTHEGGGLFENYDAMFSRLQRQREQEATYRQTRELEQLAVKGFVTDYAEIARECHIVLALDTVERLVSRGSQWLVDQKLLNLDDLALDTQLWLRDQIRAGSLPNTTLILAGRGGEEGGEFFKLIEDAASSVPESCGLAHLELKPFGYDETQEFFKAMAETWKSLVAEHPDNITFSTISSDISALANDRERTDVLCLYTGGAPVLLAIYADLMVEGRADQLLDPREQVEKQLGITSPTAPSEQRVQRQKEIQERLIDLLFGKPGLRSEILRMLMRAPRGLEEDQVTALLAPAYTREQVKAEMDSMRHLSIVKVRGSRLVLQDEVYRIYADAMADGGEKQDYETAARRELYARLRRLADEQVRDLLAERRQFLERDERTLRFDSPAHALRIRFPDLTRIEQKDRIRNYEERLDWEVERMHYALWSDPVASFNDAYFDLAESRWHANDEQADAVTHAEFLRVLNDPYLDRFIHLEPRLATKEHDEDPWKVLRRAAEQEEASRWIKRFVLRRELDRAIDFCNRLETEIEKMGNPQDRWSWQHTFAKGERLVWRAYARILKGEQAREELKRIRETIDELEPFTQKDENVVVRTFPDHVERGFVGHPAERRLRRVIAFAYNTLGYGMIWLGETGEAVRNYTNALKAMRETDFRAQQATTRNNLSRALSEMGLARARRVCLDALNLRKDLGAENPVAYSWNTLALIDNDWMRADQAWQEAATAVAYFRRTEDVRGLGLALLQLGEALRRLANQARNGRILPDPTDLIYEEAEHALHEALEIFTIGPGKDEVAREAEARIEMGSLQRDLIRSEQGPFQSRRSYREAISQFESAIKISLEHNYRQLLLDASVNVAWGHYAANELEKAGKALDTLEKDEDLIPVGLRLRAGMAPPIRTDATPFVFYQQSKMYGLRGRIAIDRFHARAEQIKQDHPGDTREKREERQQIVAADPEANFYLNTAAEAYSIAVGYAELFSARSSALTSLYDTLYDYLKRFNKTEVESFSRYAHAARELYRVADIRVFNLGNVDDFILKCFGEYLTTDAANPLH